MRLDTANKSFLALAILGLLLGMYALCGVLAGGLVTLVLSQISERSFVGFVSNARALAALGSLSTLAIGLGLGTRTFVRQVRASQRLARRVSRLAIDSPHWLPPIVARVGLQGRVLLIDTPERFSFTYGMLTPHVVVSRGLLEGASHEELRAVLEHERYHVCNLDPLKVMLVQTIVSTFFFLPALRTLRARYIAGRELAADRWAMGACGSRPVASALLKVIGGPAWDEVVLAAPAMAQPGLLDIRVGQLESGREPKLLAQSLACTAISLATATSLVLTLLIGAAGGGPGSPQAALLDGLYCSLPVIAGATLVYLALAWRARGDP